MRRSVLELSAGWRLLPGRVADVVPLGPNIDHLLRALASETEGGTHVEIPEAQSSQSQMHGMWGPSWIRRSPPIQLPLLQSHLRGQAPLQSEGRSRTCQTHSTASPLLGARSSRIPWVYGGKLNTRRTPLPSNRLLPGTLLGNLAPPLCHQRSLGESFCRLFYVL